MTVWQFFAPVGSGWRLRWSVRVQGRAHEHCARAAQPSAVRSQTVEVSFFFFKQKTAYEILAWTGVQTCALPIFEMRENAIFYGRTTRISGGVSPLMKKIAFSRISRNSYAVGQPRTTLRGLKPHWMLLHAETAHRDRKSVV